MSDSSGAAYLFDVNTGQELAKLTASSPAHVFGRSVAIDGNVAIVGSNDNAYLFDVTTGQELLRLTGVPGPNVAISGNHVLIGGPFSKFGDARGVHLFDVATGQEVLELTVSNPMPNTFARSFAISGNTAIVGAFRQGFDADSAYVFSVPEPATLVLLALGLPLLMWRDSRRSGTDGTHGAHEPMAVSVVPNWRRNTNPR